MFGHKKDEDAAAKATAEADQPEENVHRSVNTFVEDAGFQLGWGGMADALIINNKSDEMAREMRGK
jgi:hypothetical protein